MNKKLIIIDSFSLLYKAFYGVRSMHAGDGTPTNAIYGFMNMLIKLINDYKPDYCCAAFDAGKTTFRNSIYKDYKAHRQPMPEPLRQQVPIVMDILKNANVMTLSCENYEADDIIGEVTQAADKNNITAYIVTGDRDSFQLVSDNTSVIYARKGVSDTVIANKEYIKTTYGLTPHQLIDLKALMGDKSDNIPGVTGIGEKTALELVRQYNSIDGIYEHIEDIKGKLKDKLIDGKQSAYMSLELGRIARQTPLEPTFEEYGGYDFRKEEVINILNRLEMKSILKTLGIEYKAVNSKKNDYKFNVLNSPKILENYKNKTVISQFFIINDCEYLCILDDEDYRIIKNPDENYIKSFSENVNIKKVMHNLKPVYKYLKEKGYKAEGFIFDVYIAAYLIDPSDERYSLEWLSNKYLNVQIGESVSPKQASFFDSSDIDENLLSAHAKAIKELYEIFDAKLKEMDMDVLYYDIEHKLIKVLADMESEGFCVDISVLNALGDEYDKECSKLTNEILSIAKKGKDFNINSTKQLGAYLFDELKLPVIKKKKTGYSTDAEVLEKLKDKHPVIPMIIQLRKISKINSTYIKGLTKIISKDNRIHSTFNQTITTTGRISSSNPNLQNIPIKTEDGRQIRKAFVPSNGNMIVSADYSQIELRVLAHISKDKHMCSAFRNNLDIHTITASEVFNVPVDEVTSQQRSQAKAVNFGIIYGISDFGLGKGLHITKKAAQEYIDKYLNEFIGVKKYMSDIVAFAKENGYVATLFGRRRYLNDINSSNYTLRSFAERTALNTPIQGTAADIIKIAMVNVSERLKCEGLKAKLMLQIHDELIIDSPKDEVEKAAFLLKHEMENAVEFDVPLVANVSVGKDWYEAK